MKKDPSRCGEESFSRNQKGRSHQVRDYLETTSSKGGQRVRKPPTQQHNADPRVNLNSHLPPEFKWETSVVPHCGHSSGLASRVDPPACRKQTVGVIRYMC